MMSSNWQDNWNDHHRHNVMHFGVGIAEFFTGLYSYHSMKFKKQVLPSSEYRGVHYAKIGDRMGEFEEGPVYRVWLSGRGLHPNTHHVIPDSVRMSFMKPVCDMCEISAPTFMKPCGCCLCP